MGVMSQSEEIGGAEWAQGLVARFREANGLAPLPPVLPMRPITRARNWTLSPVAWRENGQLLKAPVAYEAGVYAIYADGILVYIGMAERMSNRVAQHFYKRAAALERALGRSVGVWAVKYRPERFYGERATLELRLIRRIKPELNRSGAGRHGDAARPALNRNNYRVKYAD